MVLDSFCEEHVVHDQIFYSALRKALSLGAVTTLPEFIAAKSVVEKDHPFWQKYFTVHTEEDVGLDNNGIFYEKGKAVVVVVHGGGILTPDRIMRACGDSLVNESATYREEEFDALLQGKILDGAALPLYRIEDIQKGAVVPRRFGIVLLQAVANTPSVLFTKKEFVENPLVIARCAGSLDSLETYFDKAQNTDGRVGNWHGFHSGNPLFPYHGTMPIVSAEGGIMGGNLFFPGRFVWMATS